MTNEEIKYKLNEVRMMINDGEHIEEQNILVECIKALEQQPSEGKVSMEVYKQVTAERDIAIEQLKELGYSLGEKVRTSDDCVSRQAVKDIIHEYKNNIDSQLSWLSDGVCNLPPVTPTHGTCKDCRHWKDSDGVYRRGISAESKCPINIKEVYEGNFYCKDFEKQGNEE